MNKFILFFAVAATLTMTGCDPSYFYYFDIKNDTQSELIVKIGNHESVTISPGNKKMVYSDSTLGAADPFRYITLYNLTVTINNESISNDFWLKEYWEEERNDTHHFTYTLIFNNDLLENLKLLNN